MRYWYFIACFLCLSYLKAEQCEREIPARRFPTVVQVKSAPQSGRFLLLPECYAKAHLTPGRLKPQKNIHNLVFEGAGIRGLAYAGVVEVLEEQKLLDGIQKLGGTSAGAITALLLGLGYSSGEMADIISSTRFRRFNDGRFFFIGGIVRLSKRYGWYRGQRFTRWLESLMLDKGINPDITFREWHNSGRKDLYLVATCLNRQRMLVLSHETYPDMKVVDAVRASMSIPLYFQAVFVDSTGTVFQKQNKDNTLDVLVDGGIVGNYPIAIFDTLRTDSDGKGYRLACKQTLGIRIDSPDQIANDQQSRQLAHYPIHNLPDYISAFYTLVLESLNRNELTDADWQRTISVSSAGIGPKVRRLTQEEKQRLIGSGREGAMEYFRTKD